MQMIFRPSFCAHCGEKIERTDWGLFTSRRFCQVCESEYKGHDLIPRVVVGAGILIGVFGFGSYLKSGGTPESLAGRQKKLVDERVSASNQTVLANTSPGRVSNSEIAAAKPTPASNMAMTRLGAIPKSEPAPIVQESVYICGAETKKGTPCSRRVKGNIRCFQHTGMPAMLPPDKLKVN
ncbi:hypothetical protein BH10ACI3_BH10ACI3_22530 [soil metagenome]